MCTCRRPRWDRIRDELATAVVEIVTRWLLAAIIGQ